MKTSFMASLLLYVLLLPASLLALEIPLSGVNGGNSGGAKIGFVDMERIFQVYPQTKAAKEDYRKRLDKLKLDLTQKETELGNIRDRISVLDSTLKSVQNPSASTTAPASDPSTTPDNLTSMRKQLQEKEAEFEESRKRALEDLASFENKQTQLIFGKIYEALVDLAEDEQITVIVDKASILYGSATTDLTDKLQERVRGF